MGAKTCMLVYADDDARAALANRPKLDREATQALARRLFPKDRLAPMADGTLAWTHPPKREICVGVFPGVAVVAAREIGIDRPSRLPAHFVNGGPGRRVTLHAMHSVVDWFACAQWIDGRLVRSLSLSPDSGVIEDAGERMAFELPFWSGDRPAVEPGEDPDGYPLPFHPLDLAEAALEALFGYHLEGIIDPALPDPETIPLMRFTRSRPWWRFGA